MTAGLFGRGLPPNAMDPDVSGAQAGLKRRRARGWVGVSCWGARRQWRKPVGVRRGPATVTGEQPLTVRHGRDSGWKAERKR